MRGILRIIPSAGSKKSHRLMVMRQTPSPMLIDAVVGGGRKVVVGFDTILHRGEAVPCTVYQGLEAGVEPNAFANLLWLQALIRKHGFSEAKTSSSIDGSVVVLFGDPEFMENVNDQG